MALNRIKELRKMKKMTQQELANIVGLDYTHIGRIENGERTLDVEYLEKFANALNVKPYELLPIEWQPPKLTEEEEELMEFFRKKNRATNTHISEQDTTRRYKSVKDLDR